MKSAGSYMHDFHLFLETLLFPTKCLGCEKIVQPDAPFCADCWEVVPWVNSDNEKYQRFIDKISLLFPVENAYAILEYHTDGMSQKFIHEIKYKGRPQLAKALVPFIPQDFLKDIDTLVPVPLHPKKLRRRGYNQLTEFTRELSRISGIALKEEALVRTSFDTAQAKLKKSGRLQHSHLSKYEAGGISDSDHILIIDDVFTTGTTLSEVYWAIRKVSKAKISVLVMAWEL